MLADQIQFAIPVEAAVSTENDVGDIDPIESLAPRNENLRGNQLFWSKNPSQHTIDNCRIGSLDPRVLDRDHTIAHARDEIHEESVPARLRQPYRIGHVTLHAG